MAGETSKPRLGPDPGEETAAGRTHYPTSPIFFDHIPKTAGTTLRELVRQELGSGRSLVVDDVSRVSYRSDSWLADHDLVAGHFGASIFARLPPGARVFVYSDGAFEISLPDGSMWAFDEFVHTLTRGGTSAEGPMDALLSRVREVSGREEFHDDFSIMELVLG